MSPVGAAQPQSKYPDTRAISAAPTELILLLSIDTQGGMRAKPDMKPWALKKYRA